MSKAKGMFKKSVISVSTFLSLASVAMAASIPGVTPNTSVNTVDTLKSKISDISTAVVGFVGIVSVIMLIYGAFLYVTAGANEDNAKKAKTIILYAFIGVVVAVLSYSLVFVFLNLIGT